MHLSSPSGTSWLQFDFHWWDFWCPRILFLTSPVRPLCLLCNPFFIFFSSVLVISQVLSNCKDQLPDNLMCALSPFNMSYLALSCLVQGWGQWVPVQPSSEQRTGPDYWGWLPTAFVQSLLKGNHFFPFFFNKRSRNLEHFDFSRHASFLMRNGPPNSLWLLHRRITIQGSSNLDQITMSPLVRVFNWNCHFDLDFMHWKRRKSFFMVPGWEDDFCLQGLSLTARFVTPATMTSTSVPMLEWL